MVVIYIDSKDEIYDFIDEHFLDIIDDIENEIYLSNKAFLYILNMLIIDFWAFVSEFK